MCCSVEHFCSQLCLVYSTLSALCRVVVCCIQDDDIETENKNYEMSETSIKDKSLLGTHARKLCENVDVYWITPSCADSNERQCHNSYLSLCAISIFSLLCIFAFFLYAVVSIEFSRSLSVQR